MPSSIGSAGNTALTQHLAALQAAAAAKAPAMVKQAAPAAPATPAASNGEVSLWDVLTPEEKSFFAQQSQMGPLTYGPRANGATASQSPALPRGQRIDVRG